MNEQVEFFWAESGFEMLNLAHLLNKFQNSNSSSAQLLNEQNPNNILMNNKRHLETRCN